jgi:hypothetical protein
MNYILKKTIENLLNKIVDTDNMDRATRLTNLVERLMKLVTPEAAHVVTPTDGDSLLRDRLEAHRLARETGVAREDVAKDAD